MLSAVNPKHPSILSRLESFLGNNDGDPDAYKLIVKHHQSIESPIRVLLPLCLDWVSLDPIADSALELLVENAPNVEDRERLLDLLAIRVEHGCDKDWIWMGLIYELDYARCVPTLYSHRLTTIIRRPCKHCRI